MASGPISVALPDEMRRRLAKQAKKRALKLSTTLRLLAEERLQQLDDDDQLSRAEQWQREQAWEAYDAYLRGENPEVGWDRITAIFDRALGRSPSTNRSRPSGLKRTSRRKSRG